VGGGAKVTYLTYNQFGVLVEAACTVGAIAKTASNIVMAITASHCSQTQGQPDGRQYYQPNINNYDKSGTTQDIGWAFENTDSPWLFTLNCIGCKKADALLASVGNPVTADFTHIHRPAVGTTLWIPPAANPSILIDASHPKFTIVRPSAANTVGEIIDKVGFRSGWTAGPVLETCYDYFVYFPLKRLKCLVRTGIPAYRGDSGGPVFRWLQGVGDGSQVEFLGIISVGDQQSVTLVSPMTGIQADLGALTVATP